MIGGLILTGLQCRKLRGPGEELRSNLHLGLEKK
jgi:hypothetical protein